MNFLTRLRKDCEGAAMVEFTIVFLLLLLLIGGIVDFGLAFWEMNMAAKAVERGARIAAVSDPVASGYEDINTVTTSPGDKLPDTFSFAIKCESGGCSGGYGYDSNAMNTIVYGRGNSSCQTSVDNVYDLGMCNLLSKITPANVVVEYAEAPKVGFQGRPCGPVSTITVSLKNVTFGWFFLGGLMSFADAIFPAMRTTITSEDLSGFATNPNCD
jgi:Flp pilus assembly protein TadG